MRLLNWLRESRGTVMGHSQNILVLEKRIDILEELIVELMIDNNLKGMPKNDGGHLWRRYDSSKFIKTVVDADKMIKELYEVEHLEKLGFVRSKGTKKSNQ